MVMNMISLNQLQDDKKKLAALLEKHTGIKAKKIIDHIDKFGAGTLLSGAISLCKTETQRQKLQSLFELKNIYETVKSADRRKEYILDSPDASKDFFKNYFADIADKEHVVAAFKNSNHKVIATKHISTGTINSALVDTRDIVKEALFCNAVSVVVAHNHPSGLLLASEQDKAMTKTLENALNSVRIVLNDHIIVGGDDAMALSDKGYSFKSLYDFDLSKVALSENQIKYGSDNKSSIKNQIALMKNQRASNPNIQTDINHNKNGR